MPLHPNRHSRWAWIPATLELTRIALVFTTISNIWMIVFLSRAGSSETYVIPALRELPLWAVLGCTAGVAIGMYAFGMTLNDVMDARRDRTFAPSRPIPAGRVRLSSAAALAVMMLLLSILSSIPLGPISTLVTLGCAGLVLFYNALGKHLPAVGVLTLGVIRGAHMLIANPLLGFCWPVWLTITHVVGVSAAGHRLEHKRPRLDGKQVWGLTLGWVLVSGILIAWMGYRGALWAPGRAWLWAGPIAAVVVFLFLAARKLKQTPAPREAGGALIKLGLLYLIVYDAAWLLSAGLWWQGVVIAAMLPAAWGAMALTRHLKAMVDQPLSYRRDEADAPHHSPTSGGMP